MPSNALSGSRVWFSKPRRCADDKVDLKMLPSISLAVTGTSQGLGKALFEEVLVSGERAVVTLRRPKVLVSLSDKYTSSPLLVIFLDVTDQAQISAVFEMTKRHFGRLDVVVNNTDYGLEGEIKAIPEEEARRQLEVGFWGAVRVTKKVCILGQTANSLEGLMKF